MSVDFYACSRCGDTFPDCGDYSYCEFCGNHYCSENCSELKLVKSDEDEDESNEDDEQDEQYNCCICRKEVATDDILLKALLKRFELTREDAVKIWKDDDND